MSMKNLTLAAGATLSVTGGSTFAFAESAAQNANGLTLVAVGDTDYATRRQIVAKYKPSTVNQKTGHQTKDKKTITVVWPHILGDGTTSYQVLRIETECVPSFDQVNYLELLNFGAQVLGSTGSDTCRSFLVSGVY